MISQRNHLARLTSDTNNACFLVSVSEETFPSQTDSPGGARRASTVYRVIYTKKQRMNDYHENARSAYLLVRRGAMF